MQRSNVSRLDDSYFGNNNSINKQKDQPLTASSGHVMVVVVRKGKVTLELIKSYDYEL